ncbi:MAG: hypothetical protein L0211_06620 [Planctomycetaceae bacterium]|nr:hypothetical protein [Planctomycetaceae bacterium]
MPDALQSPLQVRIDAAKLKPFRITVQRKVFERHPVRPGSELSEYMPTPTGEVRPDVATIYAVSPMEAWAAYSDSRGTSHSLKTSGAIVEAL